MFIYVARNIVNGKLYVGLTTLSVSTRWAAHLAAVRAGSKYYIHNAIRKYGPDAFVVEEIAQLMPGGSYADLCELERHIIAQENCVSPHGYNSTSGGEAIAGFKRKPMSEAQKKQISLAKKGKKFTEAQKAKLRATWTPEKRKANSERAKAMASAGLFVRPPTTDEYRAAMSAAHKGKPATEKQNAANRAAWTEERRLARGEASKKAWAAGEMKIARGYTLSDEAKAKMKASWTPERRAKHAQQCRERLAKRPAEENAAWRASMAVHMTAKRNQKDLVH